jgi:hypothetical protein
MRTRIPEGREMFIRFNGSRSQWGSTCTRTILLDAADDIRGFIKQNEGRPTGPRLFAAVRRPLRR